jgi:uncharacterized protein YdhG (YjbR/CyaY superfamily)
MKSEEKPKNITEYINIFPRDAQMRLHEMLECLRKAAPGAEESLKWGQPALSYEWILFQFAAFKNHISLYPTPSVIKALEKELSEYKISSSTIQFPLDKPLPLPLIEKIAALRVQEAKNGIKWM